MGSLFAASQAMKMEPRTSYLSSLAMPELSGNGRISQVFGAFGYI